MNNLNDKYREAYEELSNDPDPATCLCYILSGPLIHLVSWKIFLILHYSNHQTVGVDGSQTWRTVKTRGMRD